VYLTGHHDGVSAAWFWLFICELGCVFKMRQMSNCSFFGLTDVGRVRTNNEDAFSFDEDLGIMVLADGMGGYNAGEVASGMAVAFVSVELARWLLEARAPITPVQISQGIRWCFERANQSILNTASNNLQYLGMGTTLVCFTTIT